MQTPPGIAEYCADIWGCDVDLAANWVNKKFNLFYSDEEYTNDNYCGNALTDKWESPNNCGFCNPPYEDLSPWFHKAHEEAVGGFTSVFLVPTFNGDKWARFPFIWAREIVFIEGRINFIKESDGLPLKGNGRGSMLCVFGPTLTRFPAFSYIELRDILK